MADYDVILRFILDQAAQQKTKTGVDQLAGDLSDIEKITRAVTKDFETLEKQIKEATTPAAFDSLERKIKDVDKQVKDTTKAYSLQTRVIRAEAAAMVDGYEKVRVAQIKAFGSRLGGVSRTGLAVSTGLIGGVLAEANRFAKEAEDTGKATQATREWTAATRELAAARRQVDAVLLKEALPLLQQAARVASQTADFIEQNPVIIRAALETGKIVAGLSVLGILASKGISLYADARALLLGSQELAAAKLQDIAANKQLIAARLQAGAGGVDVPIPGKGVGGGIAGAVGTAVPIIGGSLLGAGLGAVMAKTLGTLEDQLTERFGKLGGLLADALASPLARILPGFGPIRLLERNLPAIQKFIGNILDVGDAAEEAGKKAGRAIGRLEGSGNEQEVVAAFQKFRADIAQLEKEAAQERTKIIEDAERKIADITAKYNQQRADINARFNSNRTSIIRDFNEESHKAEIDYAEQRADIIRDSGDEIRDIEERHQENIRKLTLEHNERMEDLTANRDALGLVKEQRRFDEQVSESEREANQEIAKRKQQTAERLQELAAEFAQERAQRQADFQQALIENEQRRQEELKQAAAAHAEELRQAREAKALQLRELQESLNAERLRRREVFIAEINDLDASLLRERGLKQNYYSVMLEDAQRFLVAYRSRLPTAGTGSTGGTTPTHDYTGYAMPGIYRMAANGQPEWVLSGAATRAAEQIIGGRLTQDAMLSALARGSSRSSSRTVNYNDRRRFDASVPLSERRAIARETAEIIAQELT